MTLANWNDAFLTGHHAVDTQHKQLFAMVNELHDAIVGGRGKEIQGPVLKKLAKYTVEHFRTEEGLMTAKGYPHIAEHKQKHADLVKRVTDLIAQFDAGKLVLPLTLSGFLGDWIRHHIDEDDKKMIAWLNA